MDITGITGSQLRWLQRLRAEIDIAPPVFVRDRLYWSQRQGRRSAVLRADETMDRFVSVVDRLDKTHALWSEAFGVGCPDGVGDPSETASDQIEHLVGRRIGPTGAWPLQSSRGSWTSEDFFDIAEVLHDLAAWPSTWDGHNYGGCVGHPGGFSPACGQALYRWEVNDVLAESDLGVRLAGSGEDRGRIVVAAADGLDTAIESALERPPEDSRDEVIHAIALFRSRHRDPATMRSSVVTLAGVLEKHRDLLKTELLSKDEGALFEIANSFDLRHRRADQRTDYDPAFLEWLFHWYLATVALVRRLLDQRQPPRAAAGRPVAGEPF
jgi:hypothetical protein